MKRTSKLRLVLVISAIVAAVFTAPLAEAQSSSTFRPGAGVRGGTWEFLLPLVYADSATVNGQNGASVDINSDLGFGFGFGYNFNENFQLNGLFTWNSRSYEATVMQATGPDAGQTKRYSNYMDTSTVSLNGVYYFLNSNITPFVSGGVGITFVDTNIQDGPASGTCWYDPWWGYVCNTYVPTKTENDMSYSAGLGMRFDVNREFGMQFGYYKTWIDFGGASGTPDFDIWRLDFIFRM